MVIERAQESSTLLRWSELAPDTSLQSISGQEPLIWLPAAPHPGSRAGRDLVRLQDVSTALGLSDWQVLSSAASQGLLTSSTHITTLGMDEKTVTTYMARTAIETLKRAPVILALPAAGLWLEDEEILGQDSNSFPPAEIGQLGIVCPPNGALTIYELAELSASAHETFIAARDRLVQISQHVVNKAAETREAAGLDKKETLTAGSRDLTYYWELLRRLARHYWEYHTSQSDHRSGDPAEQSYRQKILEENRKGQIAIDRAYMQNQPYIHRPVKREELAVQPTVWPSEGGDSIREVGHLNRGSIQLQIPWPYSQPHDGTDLIEENVLQVARYICGDYGYRVMKLVFQYANDNYRNPNVRFATNDMLRDLGTKPDRRGIFPTVARRRLAQTLWALANTRINAKRRLPHPKTGKPEIMAFSQPLVTSIAALFPENNETRALTAEQLLSGGGLPRLVALQINSLWYRGVRREDGSPGNEYVLTDRINIPKQLVDGKLRTVQASKTRTVDRLREYLRLRYTQLSMSTDVIGITRSTALEKTGITTKNVTRATQILQKALDRLKAEGLITGYSTPLPIDFDKSFQVYLNRSQFFIRSERGEGEKAERGEGTLHRKTSTRKRAPQPAES